MVNTPYSCRSQPLCPTFLCNAYLHIYGAFHTCPKTLDNCAQGGAGAEATTMGFGCASEDAGATLALFSEVIRSPALAQPKVDLYKAQVRRWLGRSRDSAAVTSLCDGD